MAAPEQTQRTSPEAAPSRDAAHDDATKKTITIVPTIRVGGGRIRNLWADKSPEDTARWTAEARVRQGIR